MPALRVSASGVGGRKDFSTNYAGIIIICMQMNLSTVKKLMDLENILVVAKGAGEGVEWTRSLGLIDANYAFGVDKQ